MSTTAAPNEAGLRLQDGIYFRPKTRPGRCYRLLLLNARAGATLGQVKDALQQVWNGLEDLRTQLVSDLQPSRLMASDQDPSPPVPGLTCLLGFGASLFGRFPSLPRPVDLQRIVGDPPFPEISWVDRAERQGGEADLALQFISDSELAVSRAVAETWLLVRKQGLRLDVVALYNGFNREDRRSWLGFHDGINNIEPSLRRQAIETHISLGTPENPAWMDGGTYMGFLRFVIDLEMWRKLGRDQQERVVGRRLDTGCPIVRIDQNGMETLQGCPVASGPKSPDYRSPDGRFFNVSNRARFSHMNRANVNRNNGTIGPTDNRIFRQSYEFIEALADGRLRLGVNFVSFQRSLSSLTTILTRPGWLGDANFGGENPDSPRLLALIGAGYYAVPPRQPSFPGAAIF